MNIWYVCDSVLPSQKANGVNIVKMCEAFSQVGHNVTLILPSHVNNNDSIVDYYNIKHSFNVVYIPIKNRKGWLYLYGLKIYLLCKKNIYNIELVYSRFPFSLFLILRLKKNIIVELHGEIWKTGLLNNIATRVLLKSKYLKKIVFISPEMKTIYENKFSNIFNKKTLLEHYYSAAEGFSVNNKFSLNGKYGINIGYVGSFNKGRGLELIFELARVFSEFGFHLAGAPEKELSNYEIDKYPNVHYYGHLSHTKTSEFRNSCDILLAPYQEEVRIPSGINTVAFMSPIKIFEYMASKKPMIVSDLKALRNVLDEKCAYLCSPTNINEWKDKINFIISNQEEAQKVAINAFEKLINNYTWEIRAKKILQNIN